VNGSPQNGYILDTDRAIGPLVIGIRDDLQRQCDRDAGEVTERVRSVVGQIGQGPVISDFDGLCSFVWKAGQLTEFLQATAFLGLRHMSWAQSQEGHG